MQSKPSSGGTLSPAENKINCGFRTHLPTLEPFFDPILHVAGKKQFLVGDRVCIQNAISNCWDNKGTISKKRDSGRSYYVDRDTGQDAVLLNNIFLKLLAAPFSLLEAAADKNHISSSPLLNPVAVPAIAVPAVREHPYRV
jgi:hypothetical protein